MSELILLLPIGYLLLASFPLVLADLREHRLPNPITYPAILFSHVATLFVAFSEGHFQQLVWAIVASALTFGIGFTLAKYADFGMGDVKLLTATNHLLAWFSPWLVLFALTLSFTLASVVGGIQMLLGKLSRQTPIAMGPYLLFGFFTFAWAPAASSSLAALS